MSVRKMTGLFMIVMGLVQIFQALSVRARPGGAASTLSVFVTALLFTAGAVLIWWNGKWWRGNSHPQE